MTAADKPDRDLINALDRLSADAERSPPAPVRPAPPASEKPRAAPPPAASTGAPASKSASPPARRAAVAKPPAPPVPAPGAPAGAPPTPEPAAAGPAAAPPFRCLACGYHLEERSGFRCSECGQVHSREALQRWFSGPEKTRVERVLWLIRACLILKLWILPSVAALAAIATAGAAGWACLIAGRGKEQTLGWHYAVAGMLVAGLLLLVGLLPGFAVSGAVAGPLEAVCACLLLITVLHDLDGSRIWRARGGTRLAHALIVAAPILALLLSILTSAAQRASFAGGSSRWLVEAATWSTFLAPHLIALGVWVWVWWRIEQLRRMLFAPQRDEP